MFYKEIITERDGKRTLFVWWRGQILYKRVMDSYGVGYRSYVFYTPYGE